MNRAVFLDRDGVLNKVTENKSFIWKKEDIKLLPGVLEALKILKESDFKLFIVTNQPVIARGIASEEEIKELHDYMNTRLLLGMIDKIYCCPHHPEMHPDVPSHALKYRIPCECRKPSPGMLLQAAKEFDVDLKKSYMIGDMVTDIVTGKNAGCKTIFVESPHSIRVVKSSRDFDRNAKADFVVKNLMEATEFVKES